MADADSLRALLFGSLQDETSESAQNAGSSGSLWGDDDASLSGEGGGRGGGEASEAVGRRDSSPTATAVDLFQVVRTPPPAKVSVQTILEQMSLEDKGKGEARGLQGSSPLHCSDDRAVRKGTKERKGLFDDDCDDSDDDIFLDTRKRKSESSGALGTPLGGEGERKAFPFSVALPRRDMDNLDTTELKSGARTPGPEMARGREESSVRERKRRSSWGGPEIEDPLVHPLYAAGADGDRGGAPCNCGTVEESEDGGTHIHRERNFEAFVVVGVEGDRVNSEHPPGVIFQYPENPDVKLPMNKLVEFCFPAGVDRTVSPRICDFTTEMIFGMSYLHSVQHCYVFLLTGGDHGTLYGICASRPEPVDLLPSFVEEASAEEWKRRRGACQVAPRVYCLLTRKPYFVLHYDIIYSVIAHERLIRMNCEFRPKTEVSDGSGRREVLDILSRYFDARVPVPGERFHLSMPFEHRDLSFFCPLGDTRATLLAQWCTVVTFRVLSLDNILCLFSAAFQERQIVVMSRNLGFLSFVILSVLPMLRPLEWQGLLVPLIPASLKTMCHAPVPFLIGVSGMGTKEKRLLHDAGVVLVDLDRNLVLLPTDLPQLPDAKKLFTDLKKDWGQIYNANDSSDNPYYTSSEELAAVQNISASFQRYCNWLLDSICHHFLSVTNPSDYEQRDQVRIGLVKGLEASGGCVDFMQSFLDTQHFSTYLDGWLKRQSMHY